jgi:hypothetical protein
MLYGDAYAYRMRATLDKARIYGRGDTIYRELLISPYRPDFEIDLPKSLDEVFAADYIRTYDAIKGAPAPPLPRAFGLTEPAGQDYMDAIRSMFSAALSHPDADLEAIVADTARKVNQNTLNFKDKNDCDKLKDYYMALDGYYAENFPEFHGTVWQRLLEGYYKVW